MPALARTRSYQYLDLFTGTPGVVSNAAVVQFTIYDISTDDRKATPLQVYPVSPATRADLNVTTDKVGTGHYRTTWAPASDATRGRYKIVWYFKLTSDGAETQITEEFDVVDTARSWGYCLPSDLRDEGLSISDASAQRLSSTITLATSLIERYTGNFFEPRALVITVDGRHGHAVVLDNPIVSLEKMQVLSLFDGSFLDIDPAYLRVYNRHLTDGLLTPDDRYDAKVELLRVITLLNGDIITGLAPLASFSTWPIGVKNVQLTGVFGFTDADGSPSGTLPTLIRHACKLICFGEFARMIDFDEREDRRERWRLTSERTRDQARTMNAARAEAYVFTPEVENILSTFWRPMALGVA